MLCCDSGFIEFLHPLMHYLLFTGVSEIGDDECGGRVTEETSYLLYLHDVGAVDGVEDACLAVGAVDAFVEAVDCCKAIDQPIVELFKILESYLTVYGWYLKSTGLCDGVAEDYVAGGELSDNLHCEGELVHGEPLEPNTTLMEPKVFHCGDIILFLIPLNEIAHLSVVLPLGAHKGEWAFVAAILPPFLVGNDEGFFSGLGFLLFQRYVLVIGVKVEGNEDYLWVGKGVLVNGILGADLEELHLVVAPGLDEINMFFLEGG